MELSITDIAAGLGLPASKVERWIRQGHIPLVRSGSRCRFDPEVLAKWAVANNLSFCLGSGAPRTCQPLALDSLAEALARGGVFHRVRGGGVRQVLEAVTELLTFIPATHKAELLARLLAREQLTSTGIGRGVAIPHPRDPIASLVSAPHIAACFLATPVDFHAVDDQPVSVLFVMLCPTVKEHLHLLSRLSFSLRHPDFIDVLQGAPSAEALLEAVRALEAALDAP